MHKRCSRLLQRLALSHVKGDTSDPLIDRTIYSFFEDQVTQYSSKEVMRSVHQDTVLSWTELKHRVDTFSAGLERLGYAKGDRLGVWLPNTVEWLIAQFATARIGVILVNVNPACAEREILHVLDSVKPKGLIITDEFRGSQYHEILTSIAPELNLTTQSPHNLKIQIAPYLQHLISVDKHAKWSVPFTDIYHTSTQLKNSPVLTHTEAINVQFTSGTSGHPKPALLTHQGILNNGRFVGKTMKLTPDDKLVIPVPLFHCFGMVLGNLACITSGASFVYAAPGFQPLPCLKAIHDYKCTAIHGVPTMFNEILNHPEFDQYDVTSLRTGVMAGTNCPVDLMHQVIEKMHMKDFTIAYGMTETSPVSWQTKVDADTVTRCETVGSIHPHVECKVVDLDNNILPVGHKGELCTRGYVVMKGYYNNAAATQGAIDKEGWMHTGDVATIDENGHCRIVGRKRDIIIRGGENVYPREIEEYLFTHPRVQDVSIVGTPDAKFGEEIVAFIITKDGQDITREELKAFCKNKISAYKVPRYVYTVPSFPFTMSGKVQKYKLRDQAYAYIMGGDLGK